jgi:hypothetical protein
MVLTKLVSLCFLTSAAFIFVNVLTGRHQELADEVSSVLHQSFKRSIFEVHDPKVEEIRHEVRLFPVHADAAISKTWPSCKLEHPCSFKIELGRCQG